MNHRISNLVAGFLLGALVTSFGFALFLRHNPSGADADTRFVLKLGHSLDTAHPVHLAMEHMRERLEALSAGQVTIDIYPSAVLGSELQCIEQLQQGSLAMTKTSTAVMENFVPELSIFGLPYLFRDNDHYWALLQSPTGQELLHAGASKGLRGLCYYEAGSRHFYTKDTPVLRPEDLQGLKIRVQNSRTAIDMVKSMGGAPTPIAWGELYSALAQGTVDGAENNLPSFTSNKHYEVCKHFTLNGHSRAPDMLMMSTRVWNQLSPRMQKWIQQAADESREFQRSLWQEETRKSIELAESEGVTIHRVDTSAFAEKVAPMQAAVQNPEIQTLLQYIRELR